MKEIIAPVEKDLIIAELTPERFLRNTNKGGNQIYIIDYMNAPNTMREIGRLREIAFRMAGGGTGKEIDIDMYDTMEDPCQQLIVWNPDAQEIIGGYRFLLGENMHYDEQGRPIIATSHMFDFSPKFIEEYMPYTIELGRSFVSVEYQSSKAGAKGLFALDNLWDGLGALTVNYPQIKYFFGKVTMYPTFSVPGRNMILYFLNKHFVDSDKLVWPRTPLETHSNYEELSQLFPAGNSFKDDYKILNQEVRALGFNIPPLVNSYMSLSPTMRMFGTAINDEFGDVEESGILIAIDEILDEKKKRHIDTYEIPTKA
ncbi:MAG: GNAT family N-acetyltransferase [Coprobacter sp.]|nr:GNAT family N-acetyltransferase [Coprobacter sp.]